ncbi:SH3 domain-containing protein [Candidatus Ozemobacteraceae bacterium]|nr:SH3 domain-containing protein [Candidatus Ozemobacteraceae bacterium]
MKQTGIVLVLAWLLFLVPWPGKTEPDAAETNVGSAVKIDEIKDEPFRDAKTVGTLAKGDRVEIEGKQGGWLSVKSGKGNGWVRMLSIRRAERPAKSGYTVDGILSLASGRAGTGKVVATTGIRGLNEETLRTAQFNAGQLALLESYRVTLLQARDFAARGRLEARAVGYLSGGVR